MTDTKNPSRREFLKTSGVMAAGGAAAIGGILPASAQSEDKSKKNKLKGKPNILLMLVDEMRYPPVYEANGAKQFRQQYLKTQNVLRASGVEFHRHYAASTACAPSRTSMFTGHYPSLHGVTQTTGAAKEANDPDVFWLDPNGVPTMGDYFRAAGYRTFYKGKWHVSNADLQIPGTHDQIVSYDDQGDRDLDKEQLYLEANRLYGYGFDGWIGPEPHGKAPLNSGSSPASPKQGRDVGFAAQVAELLAQLDADKDDDPWLMVASFVNPHDIALWGFLSNNIGLFDVSVDEDVPSFTELFHPLQFAKTLTDDLSTKPSCQESYQTSYDEWMQGIPPRDYFRFYYQLHKNVDQDMMTVYKALQQSRFFDNTIVVFTSDHGDLLGAHRYMHQKWYQAYDEALRVPLIIANAGLLPAPMSINSITSHVDLLPTLLGLAGFEASDFQDAVAQGHSDPVPLVGRDLSGLVLGESGPTNEPIYFMTDDDPSRGLDQENFYGVGYDSVIQPNHIESVIVEIDGEVWKYSRYFDNVQFWSDPDPAQGLKKDVVVTVEDTPDLPGESEVPASKRVKFLQENEEYEMYNVTKDPMELNNLIHSFLPGHIKMRLQLAGLLDQQRTQKRLTPLSG